MSLKPEQTAEYNLLVNVVQQDWKEGCERAAEREAAWYPEPSDKPSVDPSYRATPRS